MSDQESGAAQLDELLYDKEFTCPLCKQKFSSKKARHSKLRLIKEDEDFCKHFETVNPSYYLVNVCYYCGYAYTEQFSVPNPAQKDQLTKKITDNWVARDFGGARNAKMGLESLKLAVLCGQIQGENDNVLATLLLHTAWIYREIHDPDSEERFLKLAKDYFLKVYQEDTSDDVNLPKLLFLLGEISRRIGNPNEAVSWFSKLIGEQSIKDEKMISRAREQWMLIKRSKGER